MAHEKEEAFLRVLRWMRENIDVVSSVYRTNAKAVSVDTALNLDADGHPRRSGSDLPPDLDSWFLNSATGLVCCCYMDALGKVVLKGQGGHRLNTFATAHMPDLVAECDAKKGTFSLGTLYKVFRNGFVHQFAASEMCWGRKGRGKDYWFTSPDDKPGLNVDRLAAGSVAGIGRFETAFRSAVAAGEATFVQFFEWLDAD
jgi:hypothetical protein